MWGTGYWGTGLWGGAATPGPPILSAVQQSPCSTLGGTVLTIYGDNFIDPAVIEVIDPVGLEVLGLAYYFEARLDLRKDKIIAGFPALPVGTYGLRIRTIAGQTPVLLDALTYVVFADEGKAQRVRRRFAPAWSTGKRVLS